MIALISAALGLASGIFSWLNTKESLQHINNIADLQDQYNQELAKGVGMEDDALLETIYAQLTVEIQAAQAQLALANSSKPIV